MSDMELTTEKEKPSTSKPKKVSKRKRQLSNREPNDDVALNILAENIPKRKSSNKTNDSTAHNGNHSKHPSHLTYSVSKKKYRGVLKASKETVIQDNVDNQKIRKEKKKVKKSSVTKIQDLEKELKGCVLGGLPNGEASKTEENAIKTLNQSINQSTEKKKPKSKQKKGKYSDSGARCKLENDNCPIEKTKSEKKKPFNKGKLKQFDPSVDNAGKFKYFSNSGEKVVEENGAVSHQGINFTASEKKEHELKLKEEENNLELEKKMNLVCYPEYFFQTGRETYIVVVLADQALYLHGLISVRPLVGKVAILGYRMEELEKQDVYSFSSHALLSIQVLEGTKLCSSRHSYLLDYGLTEGQLSDMVYNQARPVAVLEVKKTVSPIVKKLTIVNQQQVMIPKGYERSLAMSGMIVTQENCQKYNLVEEVPQWRQLVEDIQLFFECGNAPRVVVCGGKGVGKSTLLKYIINGLLSVKGTKVQCLDVDPGQSELSLPSCISLTQITEPLLGPSYTHHVEPFSPSVKQIMVGGVTPQFGLQRYLKAMEELLELSKEQSDSPLIVNTMGWTVGTGLDLIFDTIRIVKPTHVIQIHGDKIANNFGVRLDDCVVRDSLGGIRTRPSESPLHYSLIELMSVSGKKDHASFFTPKILRELAVGIQLGDILVDISENSTIQEESTRCKVIVPWPEVVLHVCGAKIPRQRILQVLNGNLVALCQVDSHKIETISPDVPKHLIDDLDFGQCLGWGIVRGIDPLTKSLHILASFPVEVLGKVNAIIMPELHIPDRIYKFFTQGEGPYYQTMYRVGAGKLKVSRQIKPHMATFGPKKNA